MLCPGRRGDGWRPTQRSSAPPPWAVVGGTHIRRGSADGADEIFSRHNTSASASAAVLCFLPCPPSSTPSQSVSRCSRKTTKKQPLYPTWPHKSLGPRHPASGTPADTQRTPSGRPPPPAKPCPRHSYPNQEICKQRQRPKLCALACCCPRQPTTNHQSEPGITLAQIACIGYYMAVRPSSPTSSISLFLYFLSLCRPNIVVFSQPLSWNHDWSCPQGALTHTDTAAPSNLAAPVLSRGGCARTVREALA